MRFRDDAAWTLATFRSARWAAGLVTDSPCDSEAVWANTALSLAAASSVGMRTIRLAIEVEHSDAEVWHGEAVARLGDLAVLLLSSTEPLVVGC